MVRTIPELGETSTEIKKIFTDKAPPGNFISLDLTAKISAYYASALLYDLFAPNDQTTVQMSAMFGSWCFSQYGKALYFPKNIQTKLLQEKEIEALKLSFIESFFQKNNFDWDENQIKPYETFAVFFENSIPTSNGRKIPFLVAQYSGKNSTYQPTVVTAYNGEKIKLRNSSPYKFSLLWVATDNKGFGLKSFFGIEDGKLERGPTTSFNASPKKLTVNLHKLMINVTYNVLQGETDVIVKKILAR